MSSSEQPARATRGKRIETNVHKGHRKTAVSDEVVIRFDHVTKRYNLYTHDRGRIIRLVSKKFSGYLGQNLANDDLSFEIKRGEAVAFLGHNGAGKSTALKLITGVAFPTTGTITVNGSVAALLELTAGFDMQLTGRENINLRGLINGMQQEQIEEITPAIIDFAELGLYIDQPMRSYSSGMMARLGFAVAVASDPDILVVDEALSVGDRAFQAKCLRRVREIMENENTTVLFVTHNNETAGEFCHRGIVLDQGRSVYDGPIQDAIDFYETNYS